MAHPRIALLLCLLPVSLVASTPDGWISLFDGKTLDGWQANESPATWTVQDGALVARGPRSHLFYTGPVANHDFKNFEVVAEVLTEPGANSGIFVHTHLSADEWPKSGYEVQVINSTRLMEGGYKEYKMTGSIYAVRNTWRSPAADGKWFEYRVRISGKTLQTFVDGALVSEYTESPQAWRASDKTGRHLASGTFALQGHDPKSVVHYRNLRVRLLPDDSPSLSAPLGDDELDRLISQCSDQNIALIDFGILKGSGPEAREQEAYGRLYGYSYGFEFSDARPELDALVASGAVVLVVDRDSPPAVATLKAAKAKGAKLAFSSGGVGRLDPNRLRKRLLALQEAGLEWRDFWVPGK